ncbi:MAG: sensor domain-containing diguanylate cyclase [Thiotrichales bacterium]
MKSHSFLYEFGHDLAQSFEDKGIVDSSQVLVQVYSGIGKLDHIASILAEISNILPHAVITGATTSAAIHAGRIYEDATIISVCEFESSEVSMIYGELSNDATADFRAIGQVLGERAAQSETRLLLCFAAGEHLNAEELARGITDSQQDVILAGCLAAPPQEGMTSCVFAHDQLLSDAAVIVSIAGEELAIHLDHSTDWMMLGTTMEVTAAQGHRVETINDVPAKDVYSRYLGSEACQEFETTCIRFPLLIQRDGALVARLARSASTDGAIELWGNLYPGEKTRFGIPSPAAAMEDFRGTIERLQEHPCDGLFAFPSQVRMYLMKSLTEDEIAEFQVHAPTTGMFTVGQFYYIPGRDGYLHYAETVLAITEGSGRERDPTAAALHNPFSQDTLEMRAVSRLVSTTARELEEANRSLEQLANTDSLTGIYNRHKAQILLEQEFRRAQRYQRPLSLIMMDIDDFKKVNDTFGHQAGDDALIHVTRAIRPLIRETDYFARWGGEEFLIICPETGIEGTTELAERLLKAVSARPAIENVRITLSIGVTMFTPTDTLEKLVNRADKALYLSKQQGKNRVTAWES